MRKSKFIETQIVSILKQADAGTAVKDVCRQARINAATYYPSRSKFGGMEASELKRVREFEEENSRPKRAYARWQNWWDGSTRSLPPTACILCCSSASGCI